MLKLLLILYAVVVVGLVTTGYCFYYCASRFKTYWNANSLGKSWLWAALMVMSFYSFIMYCYFLLGLLIITF